MFSYLKKKIDNISYIFPILLIVFISFKAYIPNILDSALVNKLFMLLVCGFASLCIMFPHKKKKSVNILFISFIVLGLIILFATGNGDIFMFSFVLYALKDENYDSYIRLFISICAILFIFVFSLNFLGIIEDGPTIGNMLSSNRKDFGFKNPNVAFIKFFVIWLGFLYLSFKQNTISIFKHLIILVAPIYVFLNTFSRTGMIVVIVTYIAAWIIRYMQIKKLDFNVKSYLPFIPVIYACLSFMLCTIPVFYNNSFLNKVLSKRPGIWNHLLFNSGYNFRLLGYDNNLIKVISAEQDIQFALDGSFVSLFFVNGILIFFILLLMYVYAIRYYCIKKDYFKVLMIFSLLTYAFAEPILLDIAENISLILLIEPLYSVSKSLMNKIIKRKSIAILYKKICKI